jgi:transcriptional regulator with XRE-family HTH domain
MGAEWFPGRLRELREAAGLTQPQLAERVGITTRQISRLETGVQMATWATVLALAKVLGVTSEAFNVEPAVTISWPPPPVNVVCVLWRAGDWLSPEQTRRGLGLPGGCSRTHHLRPTFEELIGDGLVEGELVRSPGKPKGWRYRLTPKGEQYAKTHCVGAGAGKTAEE